MDKKRLIENMISLFALRGVEYFLPLITIPYLVRVLGQGNYGLMSFVIAFVQFFIVVTNYGFEYTATKKISINRNNNAVVSKTFFSVFIIKMLLGLACFILFVLLVYLIPKFRVDSSLYLIGFIAVIGNVLLPIWFFQGMENMKFFTFVNIFVRTFTTLSIFFFVNNSTDYTIALFIQSSIPLLCGIVSIFIIYRKFEIQFILPNMKELKEDFAEGWHVFTTSFMANILASSGTFVLGLFHSKEVVGIYAALEKLIKALIGLFSPVTQALFPRVSAKFSVSFQEGSTYVYRWGKVMSIFAIMAVLITSIFSFDILNLLFGDSYKNYDHLLQIFSIWVFTSVLNNFLGIQYLIGSGNQKIYTKAFVSCTIITILLFLIFAPVYSVLGIIIGVNIGEIILTCSLMFYITRIRRKAGIA